MQYSKCRQVRDLSILLECFLPTRRNEAFRGVGTVVGGDHIDYILARKFGGSVEADQLHPDELWGPRETS